MGDKEQTKLQRGLLQLLSSETEKMTEKQLNILVAAVELFGEKGYAGTSTKEISVRAGVAEATIFKHYGTKKELMLALSEQLVRDVIRPLICSGLDRVFQGDYETLEDFMYTLIRNRLELVGSALPILKVLMQEIPFQPEVRAMMLDHLPLKQIASQFETMSARGLIIDLPGEAILKLFLTSFFGYLFTNYLFLPEVFHQDPELETDRFVQFLVRGLKRPEEGK